MKQDRSAITYKRASIYHELPANVVQTFFGAKFKSVVEIEHVLRQDFCQRLVLLRIHGHLRGKLYVVQDLWVRDVALQNFFVGAVVHQRPASRELQEDFAYPVVHLSGSVGQIFQIVLANNRHVVLQDVSLEIRAEPGYHARHLRPVLIVRCALEAVRLVRGKMQCQN